MTADETINRWAAKKLDVPVEAIDRVEFIYEEGYWLSELTYQPAYSAAHAHYKQPRGSHKYGPIWIDVHDGSDFSALLREIIEAADKPLDPPAPI